MVSELEVDLVLLHFAPRDAEGSVLGIPAWLREYPREVRYAGDCVGSPHGVHHVAVAHLLGVVDEHDRDTVLVGGIIEFGEFPVITGIAVVAGERSNHLERVDYVEPQVGMLFMEHRQLLEQAVCQGFGVGCEKQVALPFVRDEPQALPEPLVRVFQGNVKDAAPLCLVTPQQLKQQEKAFLSMTLREKTLYSSLVQNFISSAFLLPIPSTLHMGLDGRL